MAAGLKLGNIVEAEITKITDFGAFAKIDGGDLGLIHISQISNRFVKDVNQHLKAGDKVKARVIKLGPGKKIDLSLKINQAPVSGVRLGKATAGQKNNSGFKSSDFEVKLKKFLRTSQTTVLDLKKRDEKYHR